MSSASPIKPVIQEKLNSKRKILSRQGSSAIYSPSDENSRKQYQQNIVKTPYIIMASSQAIQATEKYFETGSNGEGVGEVKQRYVDETYPKGFYMLSNQEYSSGLEDNTNNPKINVGTNLYNARSLPGKTKVPSRPAPGIKDLTSEFTSTNNTQFNRKVSINFTCYSLRDLEILTERFMTFGRKVYVQWGWATQGQNVEALINEEGKVNYSKKDEKNEVSEISRLQEMVIEKGKGDFDAIIGFVNNFNWTLREDGGFDCTTELTAQGLNILDQPVEQETPDVDGDIKDLVVNNETGQYMFFTDEINDLHNTMIKELKGSRELPIFNDLQAAEVAELSNSWKSSQLNFKNVSLTSKKIFYDSNFITIQTDTKTRETNSRPLNKKKQKQKKFVDAKKDFRPYFESNVFEEDSFVEPGECWVKWGWFEDNILNKYYSLYDIDKTPSVYIRSIQRKFYNDDKYRQLNALSNEQINRIFSADQYSREAVIKDTLAQVNLKISDKELRDFTSVTSKLSLFESSTIDTDKNFKTVDIGKFLFPGNFSVEPEWTKNIAEKQNALTKSLSEAATETQKYKKGSEKYKEAISREEEIRRRYIELVEEAQLQYQFRDIQSVQEAVSNSVSSVSNLNEITETGKDKYLILKTLEQVLQDTNVIQRFEKENSFQTDSTKSDFERGEGYIRNIFINVKNLQEIFGKSVGSQTLGESLNLLFNSLSSNVPANMANLVCRYNAEEQNGQYKIMKKELGSAYSKQYDYLESTDNIYQFPVHQQDSIVLSQELNTDLSSTQFTVLQSKAMAEQVDFQDKKNISIAHQSNFVKTDIGGNKVEDERYEKSYSLTPAYRMFGFKYKNPFGSNPNIPIINWTKNLKTDSGEEFDERQESVTIDNMLSSQDKQSEKDLESATSIFQRLPIPYDINGVLKSDYHGDMLTDIKYKTKNKKTKLKVSDFGLIGLTTTLTLTGIAGIYPSNVFTTTYLPTKFTANNLFQNKNNTKSSCHFWTTGVTQNCSAETWTTQVEGRLAWRYQE